MIDNAAPAELEDEERRFAELAERAQQRGYSLLRVRTGYLLQRGTTSYHSTSLDALAAVITRGGGAQ